MRRGRTLIFVVLIIIIVFVVAYFGIRQFLAAQQQAAQQQVVYVEIYTAGQNIPQGTKITQEVLSTIKIQQTDLKVGEFTTNDMSSLVGKVAKFPLDQGVVITASMVGDSANAVAISGPQWASLIPPGMTAISIPIKKIQVAGYGITDGAHINLNACFSFVDVDPTFQTILPNKTATLTGTGYAATDSGTQGTGLPVVTLGVGPGDTAQGRLELDPSLQQPYYLVPSEAQRPRVVCQMLLQDAVVLKLGDFTAAAAAESTDPNAQAVQAQTAPVTPTMVTLIVTPQDSITLTYLMVANAQITMTLRNPTDQARQATEASTLQFLLSQYNIPVPAKLPFAASDPFVTNLILPVPEDNVPAAPPAQ